MLQNMGSSAGNPGIQRNKVNIMLKAYKYRMYPNKSQRKLLAMSFGCVRFIWNKNVEVFNDRGEFKTSTEYRAKFPFLKDVSAAIIQQKEIDFKQYKTQFFSKKRKKTYRPTIV